MEAEHTRRPWLSWEWWFGALIITCLILSSRLGHGLPQALQNVAQLVVLSTPLLLTVMAWVQFALARKKAHDPRWRLRLSLLGCIALSLALAIPLVVIFFAMIFLLDWTRLAVWCLASSLLALLAGSLGARSVRFPLIFGGLVMVGLVVIIPLGVL